jgi:hypothetical protein
MSNERPLHDNPDEDLLRPSVSLESLANPLSAIAFWLAIAIPVLYIPFLTTGINSLGELGLFLGVFGLHLAALYTGRSYRRG